MANTNTLLSIIEIGGYPDFTPLYRQQGFTVETSNSMRKAVKIIRKLQPAVIVAEFNFQSDFRDRTSSLETLMATVQGHGDARVIIFYEPEQRTQLERLLKVFDVFDIIPFPVSEQRLQQALERATQAIAS